MNGDDDDDDDDDNNDNENNATLELSTCNSIEQDDMPEHGKMQECDNEYVSNISNTRTPWRRERER